MNSEFVEAGAMDYTRNMYEMYLPLFKTHWEPILSEREMSSQQSADVEQQMGMDAIVGAIQNLNLNQQDAVMSDADSGIGSPTRRTFPANQIFPGSNTTTTTATTTIMTSTVQNFVQAPTEYQRTVPSGSPNVNFGGAPLHSGPNGTGIQHYYIRMVDTGRDFEFNGFPSYNINIPPPSWDPTVLVPIDKPWGIAVHSITRDIFVTDRGIPEIRRYRYYSGQILLVQRFSDPGLRRPTGIAVDACYNRILVADKDNHRISIFRIDGAFIMSFGKQGFGNGDFNRPWDVAVSPNGNFIAVADSRNHRVQLFDSNGNFLRKFTVFEVNPFIYKAEFDYPRGITFDRTGTKIYVTDFNLRSVFALDLTLTEKHALTPKGALNRPQGLTVNIDGNVIVCDTKDNCLQVVSPCGFLVKTVHSIGSHMLKEPLDAAEYGDGRICVLEASGRIYMAS